MTNLSGGTCDSHTATKGSMTARIVILTNEEFVEIGCKRCFLLQHDKRESIILPKQ